MAKLLVSKAPLAGVLGARGGVGSGGLSAQRWGQGPGEPPVTSCCVRHLQAGLKHWPAAVCEEDICQREEPLPGIYSYKA